MATKPESIVNTINNILGTLTLISTLNDIKSIEEEHGEEFVNDGLVVVVQALLLHNSENTIVWN